MLPTTHRGRWAGGLALAFFPSVLAAGFVPGAAAIGFVCGFAGGVLALLAIIRDRERALTVLAAVLPFVIAVGFLIAELISGGP